MKSYLIPTPDRLRDAADMIKWQSDRKKVDAVIDEWERGDGATKVTLELGRSAQLFAERNGKKTLLAAMYVAGAKEFVKELSDT